MTDALDLGIGRDQFWRLTVRELFQEFGAAVRRHHTKLDEDARQMWLGLSMYGRLMTKNAKPKLADYLISKPTPESPERHHERMKATLYAIAATFGGKVRKVPK
jgi:hypothetical protein